jgi:hypothetical protein
MGTRSLTVVVDDCWDKKQELVVMYRQFDGYPSVHGRELKDFLNGTEGEAGFDGPIRIVNGLSSDKGRIANGAGCLAAQLFAHFKSDPGGIYLHAAGTRDCGEEYVYTVTAKTDEPIHLKVVGYDKTIYDGPVAEFNPNQGEEG